MDSMAMDANWLVGKQVIFSGRLASMSRAEAVKMVRACGGEVAPEVSPLTAYVIVGQESEPLTKDGRPAVHIRAAHHQQKNGSPVEILTEEEFLKRSGLDTSMNSVRQLYTEAQVSRILKIPKERLGRWLRCGLVESVETKNSVSFFDYKQVSWAKTLCNLAEAGVKPDKIRRSLRQLKKWLSSGDPLAQLRLLEKDGQLLVRLESGQLAEPYGQPHLDFEEAAEAATGTVPTPRVERTAHDWFMTGTVLEEEEKYPEAADAYHQALMVGGPDAETCFNLANVLYNLGQKERAAERYNQSVEIDPGFAEAWNNLGNVQTELGDVEHAVTSLKQAVRLEPDCPTWHYNLADLLDEVGRGEEAQPHWRAYLRGGEPGQWADHARQRISAVSS